MKPLNILVQPRNGAAGARVDVRLHTGGSAAAAGMGGFEWQSAVQRRPKMTQELLSPALDGKIQVGRADFVVSMLRLRSYDARLLYWPGAPVIIYDARPIGLASAPIEFTGYVKSASMDLDASLLTLNCEVSTQVLDKPVLFNEFTGAGGVNGAAEFRGKLKPAGFGTVKNIEPVWFDPTNNVGMIDGYGNCTAITALFEGGNDFGAKVADYADYATLVARIVDKTVAPGRWATCVAAGLVGLGAPPVKPITVDATFGTNRPGALIRRLMETHAGVLVADVDVAAFAALDVAVNRPVHHWMGDQRAVKDLVESIAGSCNATPIVTFQGKYSITRAFGGANALTINKQAPTQATRVTAWRALEPEVPVWRMKMRAARPGVVLNTDQILYADDLIDRGAYGGTVVYRQGNLVWGADGAQYLYINAVPAAGQALPVAPATATAYWQQTKAAPDAGDLRYDDGTLIEALKPAEVGANITGTHTAAAITGQAATATDSNYSAITGTRPDTLATAGDSINQDIYFDRAGLPNWQTSPAAIGGQVSTTNPAPSVKAYRMTRAQQIAANYFAPTLLPVFPTPPAGQVYPVGVVAGVPIYQSIQIKLTRAVVGVRSITARLQVDWANAAGYIGSSVGTGLTYSGSAGVGATTGWVSLSDKFTPPAGATSGNVFFTFFADTNTVAGLEFDVEATGYRIARTSLGATVGGTIGTDIFSSGGVLQTDATLITSAGTAAAIAGQGALATVSEITTQIAAGRTTDNVVPNANLIDGSTKWSLASGMTTITASAHGPMPAYNALQIPNGAASAVAYANSNTQIPFPHPRAYVSASVFTSGSAPMGSVYLACFDYLGASLGDVSIALSAPSPFTWQQSGGWLTLPANTRSIVPYWFGGSAVAYVRTLTNLRVAATAQLATVGGTLGTDIFSSGGTVQTDAALITAIGTAAAIASQAATATSSDFAVITGATRPSAYAGSSLVSLIKVGSEAAKFDVVGNSIRLNAALATAWHAPAYSWQSYGNGMAISARSFSYVGRQIMGFALATNNNNADASPYYNRINYGWLLEGMNGSYIEGGTYATLSTNVDIADILTVAYDGVNIYYIHNETVKRTVNVGPGLVFFPKFVLDNPASGGANGTGWQDILVFPFTQAPDINRNVYDLGSGTYAVIPRGELRTPLGTAAAIAGQGALAVLSTVNSDTHVVDGSTYGRIRLTELTSGVVRLGIAGSGYRLGDARNMPAITSAGVRYRYSQNPTFSAPVAGSPATSTISLAAGDLIIGGQTIALSAMSVNVTGTNSTTVVYYLYIDNPTYAGGAQTLVATTSATVPYQSDGRIFMGQVSITYPASGTGTGGGGSGGGGGGLTCVHAGAWVEVMGAGHKLARDVEPGDMLVVLDETMEGTRLERCVAAKPGQEHGWLLTSNSGVRLTVSESAPLTLRDGSTVLPFELNGQALAVKIGDALVWERCFAQPLGYKIDVIKISCGENVYAAGDIAGRSIMTHNVKP
jgi:hypothetical protein